MNIFLKKICKNSIFVLIFLFFRMTLYADRGDVEQFKPALLPNSNFPEYFNTSLPPERHFLFSLPIGTLTFGVTKNFSISLNLPLIFYMIETWNPGVLFSLRYRFFSNEKLSSALTGYAGYFRYKDSGDITKIYYINGTYNNLITVNKNNFITTQFNGLAIKYKSLKDGHQDADIKSLDMLSLSIGHMFILNQSWVLSNLVAVPIVFNLHEENSNHNAYLKFKHITNFPFFYRMTFDWNVTSHSLITFGGFLLTQSDIPLIVLPWLGWSVVF